MAWALALVIVNRARREDDLGLVPRSQPVVGSLKTDTNTSDRKFQCEISKARASSMVLRVQLRRLTGRANDLPHEVDVASESESSR